jgi:hypothetical protein
MAKKKSEELNPNLAGMQGMQGMQGMPGGSSVVDFETTQSGAFENNVVVDSELIESIENQIQEKKEELKSKVYAVTCSDSLFTEYENFMKEKAEWNSTEALGVVEINKQIARIKKEGIKDGVIYLGALPLEASHYFLSKSKGTGVESAEAFIRLYKVFDQALNDAKTDASSIKDLEKQLAAAMQGITLG